MNGREKIGKVSLAIYRKDLKLISEKGSRKFVSFDARKNTKVSYKLH